MRPQHPHACPHCRCHYDNDEDHTYTFDDTAPFADLILLIDSYDRQRTALAAGRELRRQQQRHRVTT